MTNTAHNISLNKLLAPILWLALAGVSFYWHSLPTQAETGPFNEQNQITATVPDHTAPSTPILIAPPNNALLNTAVPEFTWLASSDDVALGYYTLYLDGEIWFDNIPLVNTENSSYTLTYNSATNYYTLKPKNLLSNGTFTWKVAATDTSENSSESVTWSFSIDTRAPTFVIEEIGTKDTSISAHDPATIPEEPVVLTENEPLLKGTGEGASTVAVTITTPDETATAAFTINNNGTWELQLGILPRDVTIYLDFVITDPAGNTSILLDVPIRIESSTITIPATTPPGSPVVPPQTPPPSPPISIPDLSPREWRQELLETAAGFLPLSLKEITQEKLIKVPEEPRSTTHILLQITALITLATIPLLAFFILLTSFGKYLPVSSLPFLAGLAGLFPRKAKHTGIVFEASSGKAVPFARVIFSGITIHNERIYTQVICNAAGFYEAPYLPPGNYICSVVHPSYNFPTSLPREKHLHTRDFYCGEQITVSEAQSEQQLAIPVDTKRDSLPIKYQLLGKLQWGTAISWISFIFASVITILFPSVWNVFAVGLYIAIILVRYLHRYYQPQGLVVDQDGRPLSSAILRFINTKTGNTLSLARTNIEGKYTYQKFAELPEFESGNQVLLIKYHWQFLKMQDLDVIIATASSIDLV